MFATAVIAHKAGRDNKMLGNCVSSIVKDDITVEIIIESQGNKSESRNAGVAKARGVSDIILFFDDDVELRQGCIKELMAPFSDPKVGIVGGTNIAFTNIPFKEQVSASLLASPLTMFRSCARYTPRGDIRETDESEIVLCNMAVRRKVFEEAGGFPSNCIPCEENVLINNVQKLGYKIIYSPFAFVYHNRRAMFMPYFHEIFNYGKGRGIMMRRGSGGPKMLFKPNRKWFYYFAGFIGHYVSYISGLAWGLINGERVSQKAAEDKPKKCMLKAKPEGEKKK